MHGGSLLWLGLAAACATSPLGRKQLILVPPSEMSALGAQAFQDIKQREPVESDPAVNRYVRCVADPIVAAAAGAAQVDDWEVVVFRSDEVNAFALPGGKIGVYTGLFRAAETPDQLAAVLGHEVGHVLARHSAERVSQSLATTGSLTLVGAFLGGGEDRERILAALGLGAQVGYLLPHSRAQEQEADRIGLDLTARAGFDPAQAVHLWENMARVGGSRPPVFLSTHPSPEGRIADIRQRLPGATATYRQAGARPVCRRP